MAKNEELRVVEGEPNTFIIEEFVINKFSLIDNLFKIGYWRRYQSMVYFDKEIAINKAKKIAANREMLIKEKQKNIEFARRKKNIIWTEK